MTTLPADELVERLKDAAKKATPGPYAISTCCDYWLEAGGKGIALFGEITWRGAENTINDQSEMEANARLHALCSPSNIVSLLDLIAAQESEISSLRAKLAEAMEVLRPVNMQEVRLAVGEGKLRPIDVLNGVNAELKLRARRLIEGNGNG